MGVFPCQKCGICCRHIDKIPPLIEFDTGDGKCKYLKDNVCSIYDNRPEICRVDVMYEKYYAKQYTEEEFYNLNLEGCKKLQSLF